TKPPGPGSATDSAARPRNHILRVQLFVPYFQRKFVEIVDFCPFAKRTPLPCLEPRAMVEKLPESNGEDEISQNGVLYACQEQRSRLLVGHGKQKAAKGAEHD